MCRTKTRTQRREAVRWTTGECLWALSHWGIFSVWFVLLPRSRCTFDRRAGGEEADLDLLDDKGLGLGKQKELGLEKKG